MPSSDGEESYSVLDRYDARGPNPGGLARGDEGHVEDSMFLEDALPQLKALEQQAVTLFFFDELSKSDVARRLDISVNYASYLIKRGTDALRRILEANEPVPGAQLAASAWAQQQVRAAYLLDLAKTTAPPDARRTFRPKARVAAASKGTVSSLTQFSGWLDEEVARVGRYGGEFSVCWLQIRNWLSITAELNDAQKRSAAASAAVLVRRLSRGIDKVAALQSPDPAGLHFLVLMPSTGIEGQALIKRLGEAFAKPDIPAVVAPLHTRIAFATCPKDGRVSEEIFELLGAKLRAEA